MDYDAFKRFASHAGGQFVPSLASVYVYATPGGHRAQVGNGRYWVDVPTELPPMLVSAERFTALLAACRGEPEISVGDQFVSVRSGRVRGRVQLDPGTYPSAVPEKRDTRAVAGVGAVLEALLPFAAADASRPWATSICLSGKYGYSTNNVIVARHPLHSVIARAVNIPSLSVGAIVERGEVVDVGHSDNAATFYYQDGSWVRTLLVSGEWPTATVDGYVDPLKKKNWKGIHPELADLVTTAAGVCSGRLPTIQFDGDGFSLTDETFSVSDVGPVPDEGRVTTKMAALALGLAEQIQWHTPRQDTHAFRCGELVGILGGTK